jgi:ribosomal protein S18 acetylase RimI-like enzyme
MEVRPATPQDVPSVLPMVRKIASMHEHLDSAKYTFRADPGEMYRNWLRQRATDPRSVFLVAETDDAKRVAFLIGTVEDEIPIYRVEEIGFIHDLWVEEDYRHEGVARQLVMRAVERFGEIGVSQIRLDTAAANEAARRLFERCGFRTSVTEMLTQLEKPQ